MSKQTSKWQSTRVYFMQGLPRVRRWYMASFVACVVGLRRRTWRSFVASLFASRVGSGGALCRRRSLQAAALCAGGARCRRRRSWRAARFPREDFINHASSRNSAPMDPFAAAYVKPEDEQTNRLTRPSAYRDLRKTRGQDEQTNQLT